MENNLRHNEWGKSCEMRVAERETFLYTLAVTAPIVPLLQLISIKASGVYV